MPGLLAALPAIIGAIGGGVSIGEGISALTSKPPATAPTTPTSTGPTTPTAPQLTTAANTQYLTGGGVSPDYLQSLLAGGSLAPQTGATSGLSGFTTG